MSGAGQYDPARAVQYGRWVELAYSMYAAAPTNPTPPPPSPFPPDYKFVAWVQMKDFVIEDGNWTFYGLIAQHTAKPNGFVLAIRGTENLTEWWDDLTSAVPVPLKDFGQVAYGFNRIYQTLRVVDAAPSQTLTAQAVPQPAGTFAQQVAAAARRHAALGQPLDHAIPEVAGPTMSIEVTGHSLGAALATLYVAENVGSAQVATPFICTFASPRVGDAAFAAKFGQLGITSWRIVNELDIVPKLPFLGFAHVAEEHAYNSGSSVNWSLACWHDLATYLNLLDPSQPIAAGCLWPKTAAAAAAAMLARAAPATAALAATKEIALSAPAGGASTINITIRIGGAD
jgi:Lipase (class 3)